MRDFFGRELKDFDLVVSKPGGRNASMRKGIIVDGNVYFGGGSYGGSDIVLITDPELQHHQEALKQEYINFKSSQESEKIRKRNERIEKKDFKRFGLYDGEIYLGKCLIQDKPVDDVWLMYNSRRESLYIEFWGWRRGKRNFISYHYRSVEYPQKFIEEKLFTREEVEFMILACLVGTDCEGVIDKGKAKFTILD